MDSVFYGAYKKMTTCCHPFFILNNNLGEKQFKYNSIHIIIMNYGVNRKMKTLGCKMPDDYDPSFNYMAAHMEWLSKNKNFIPERGLSDYRINYYMEMAEFYNEMPSYHETTYHYFKDDVKYFNSKKNKSAMERANELFGVKPDEDRPATYFVTWNFEEKYFEKNKDKIVKNLNKFLNNKWLVNGRAVFEYNTKNGNHPHIMALLETKKYRKIYDMKDAIFQLALSKGLEKNFIDIKYAKSYHTNYINLEKTEEKHEYLAKDVEWREAQGLDEEYSRQN